VESNLCHEYLSLRFYGLHHFQSSHETTIDLNSKMAQDILLDFPSSNIRICLQVYFNLLFLLISIGGNSCYANFARLQLVRYGNIPVVKLTGWLDWAQVILFNWHFRTNALGFVGIIMVSPACCPGLRIWQ
jgi:hypothetical protein